MNAARQVFRYANTALGAISRSFQQGNIAPLVVEEAEYYAEQHWRWTGIAAVGALASEGLWAYQVKKQREESERPRSRSFTP
jgi:uncharacterized membrane protein YebE (DUF533 family)